MADGSLFGGAVLSTPVRRVRARGMVIDLYAGGGGASEGIRRAHGRAPDVAINHDILAIRMHEANHLDTLHLQSDVDAVSPLSVIGKNAVWLLWCSPQCTHFSKARGKAPKSKQQREQGWSVIRWVREARPLVMICENVEEWLTWGPLHPDDHADPNLAGQPIKERTGETWAAWVAALRELGYVVEWRLLVAADFGAPTTRERLFVVARRDGQPIVWPAPTHAPRDSAAVAEGRLLPWPRVADQIDWSIPMCSIFATREEAKAWAREHKAAGIPQRPLAEATQRRIAEGIRRFVLGKRRPFLVNLTHGVRVEDIDDPARTITAAHRGEKSVVVPTVTKAHGNGWDRAGSGTRSAEDPLGTNTATEQFAVSAASLIRYHGERREGENGRVESVADPLPTQTTEPRFGLVSASLLTLSHGGRPEDIEEPANTLTATPKGGDRCLIGVGLVNTRNGEREGQAPRVRDLEDPAPTITAQGSQGGVAAAWVVRHNGSDPTSRGFVIGRGVDEPLATVTAKPNQALGAVLLDKLHGSARAGASVEEPCPTVTSGGGRGGGHAAIVQAEIRTDIPPAMVRRARQTAAFLTAYYGQGGTSASAADPSPTVVTKARLGLVLVELETTDGPATLATVEIDGALWIIVDISVRMLTPRELARCQGFPDSYVLPVNKSDAIARIGNSVVPHLAEALVRANLPSVDGYEDDAMAAK